MTLALRLGVLARARTDSPGHRHRADAGSTVGTSDVVVYLKDGGIYIATDFYDLDVEPDQRRPAHVHAARQPGHRREALRQRHADLRRRRPTAAARGPSSRGDLRQDGRHRRPRLRIRRLDERQRRQPLHQDRASRSVEDAAAAHALLVGDQPARSATSRGPTTRSAATPSSASPVIRSSTTATSTACSAAWP